MLCFNKSTNKCNIMANNMECEGCLMHTPIYNVKTTFQLVEGWLAFWSDFQAAIGGSNYS
jgi:hypothetical protein